jgi:hypothetical protein
LSDTILGVLAKVVLHWEPAVHDLHGADLLIELLLTAHLFDGAVVNLVHSRGLPFMAVHTIVSDDWASADKVDVMVVVAGDPDFANLEHCF